MISLLYGPNAHARDQQLEERLHALAPEVQIERMHAERVSLEDLVQLLNGTSLFAPQRAIVLKDASTDKTLWDRLGDMLSTLDNAPELILVEQNPDKRTKTYKWLQKHAEVIECKEPGEAELVAWAQAYARRLEANLEPEAARFLVHYLGEDQSLMAREIEKLALAGSSITRALIEMHCEPTPQASAFEVIDAALGGDHDRIQALLAALRQTEDPYRFFGLLASQAGVLAACVAAGSRTSQQIAKDCAVHPYVAQKTLPLARRLGAGKVRRITELLAECDLGIKTSRGEPWQLIEFALMRMSTSSV